MKTIKMSSIAKIEGRADFLTSLQKGEFKEARIYVREGARLIEGIVLDRKIEEIPVIISRICGICPIVHNLCAIRAIENALKIKVSQEIELLRKLMLSSQIIHSHGLHLFFLSLPDFFELASDLKLIKKYPRETKQAILIRDFGIKAAKAIGGRAIHPTNSEIGGFRVFPEKKKLKELLKDYDQVLEAAWALGNLFRDLNYPKFHRSTNFVSLYQVQKYGFDQGNILFNSGGQREEFSPQDFFEKIKEIEKPGEAVKRTKFQGKIYLVGALARVNNNYPYLNPEAKKLWSTSNILLPDFNIFHNVFAQAVETVHFIEESKKIIEELLKLNSKKSLKKSRIKVRGGSGLATLEAPRGTLFHYYQIDNEGKIVNCNIITPTAQFLTNLEEDLKKYTPEVLKKTCLEECQKKVKMLIRAYDPCISCATH